MLKNKNFISKSILALTIIMFSSLAFAADINFNIDYFKRCLIPAVDKALNNVDEGSRLVINQVSVSADASASEYGLGVDRKKVNDLLIALLLDSGYKVVNEKTTAKANIEYFLNVRITESIRIQVINAATGEYVGNVTVCWLCEI